MQRWNEESLPGIEELRWGSLGLAPLVKGGELRSSGGIAPEPGILNQIDGKSVYQD